MLSQEQQQRGFEAQNQGMTGEETAKKRDGARRDSSKTRESIFYPAKCLFRKNAETHHVDIFSSIGIVFVSLWKFAFF